MYWLKVYISIDFSIATELYSHHQKFQTFSSLKQETPYPVAVTRLLPLPAQPLLCVLSPSIFLFWKLHINGIIQYMVLVTGFFTWPNVFKVHPCCSMPQYFFFNCLIAFHCMAFPYFVYPFISLGTFRYSAFWLLRIILLWAFM